MNNTLKVTNKLLASLLNSQIMGSKLIEIQIQQTQTKHLLRQAGATLKEFQETHPHWFQVDAHKETTYLSLQDNLRYLSDRMASLASEAAATYRDIETNGNQTIMEAEDEDEGPESKA